ncbi:hypothetical protein CHARACLAT_027183 [Characodon lateralis]|uniref:Uncharacterized protein n=1 Tax=Characodon lateralis TaxID=208331 RepID=A0ABU7DAE6_9TELE|nr:hypothetical protein [Characodon lateralis]
MESYQESCLVPTLKHLDTTHVWSCSSSNDLFTVLQNIVMDKEKLSLSFISKLSEIVRKLKLSFCADDNIPLRLLKEVFNAVGPYIDNLINTSLSSSCGSIFS